MKINDARITAASECRLPIDTVNAVNWAYEAIGDICAKYPDTGKRVEDNATITTAPSDFEFTKSLIKLIEISDLDNNGKSVYNSPRNFTVNSDNTVTFEKSGNYRLKYFAIPDKPANENSDIPLPPLFAPCITPYLMHKARGGLMGYGDANAISYYQLYESRLHDAEIARQKQGIKRRMPPGRRG